MRIRKDDWRWREMRAEMWLWSDGLCWYCGVRPLPYDRTLDHILPRISGGIEAYANLVPSCRRCNVDKGKLSLDEYRETKSSTKEYSFFGETCGLDLPYTPAGKPINEHPLGSTSNYFQELLTELDAFQGVGRYGLIQ